MVYQTFVDQDENGIMYRMRNCPMSLVPTGVIAFLEALQYYKAFPGAGAPAYGQASPRWMAAWRYYNSKLNEYGELMRKR